ncbi:RNA methyltransferase [Pseudactinotalea sp. HY158]|uniref:TrmH family RNA methyltransferase n=1 Tax=Pseudactinotalea sp. HY158 TaxID=2654547 RepID=UPI001E34D3BC|nr:RNA methyltransferase [Pseudactinotalea sp. HY158]
MPIVDLSDPSVPAHAALPLPEYTRLTDVALRRRLEPERGLYLAESTNVIARAVEAGHEPISFLTAPRWLPDLDPLLRRTGAGQYGHVPVYVAPEEVLEKITGFHLHRSAIAAMHRPELPAVADVLRGARRVAVLEGITDHANVGAALRSAAGLAVDAVLVTPTCADPLYRRSIRVSMGTVFQVPWTRIDPWPGGLGQLRAAGFTTAALALREDALTLDELAADPPERLALILGTEGPGLSEATIAAADLAVRIPMSHGVDSLNVAAAAAVAFWATR